MTTLIPKFEQLATGAVNRAINEKLKEWVSITDFGAVGNGITDNTAAIQAAHDSLPSTGGIIYFPPGGWWRVNSTINITKGGVTLFGQGQGAATNLYNPNHNFDVFNVTGENFSVENISFSADSATSGATSKYVFNISGDAIYLNNVFVIGAHSFLKHTGGGLTINGLNVSQLAINHGIGIDLSQSNGSSIVIMSACTFSNFASSTTQAYAGVWANAFGSLQMTNCNFFASGTGLLVTPTGGQSAVGIQLTGVFFDHCNAGAYLYPSATGLVPQGSFVNCWFGASYSGGGLYMKGTAPAGLVEGIIVDGCQITSNSGDGITIANEYVRDINITANLIYGNTGSGVNVYPNANRFNIIANQIGDCVGAPNIGYGVEIQTGTSNKYIITNNYIQGNTFGNLVDFGSGTDKIVNNNLI